MQQIMGGNIQRFLFSESHDQDHSDFGRGGGGIGGEFGGRREEKLTKQRIHFLKVMTKPFLILMILILSTTKTQVNVF